MNGGIRIVNIRMMTGFRYLENFAILQEVFLDQLIYWISFEEVSNSEEESNVEAL